MQLMNWYLINHVILESDLEKDPKSGRVFNRGLFKLKKIEPPWKSPVFILVSRGTNEVCSEYARHLNSKYEEVEFIEFAPWDRS